MKIFLVSNSPRRRALMTLLQIPFESRSPQFEEVTQPHMTVDEEVLYLARNKAVSIREPDRAGLWIGCDTLVEWQGEKIGKPSDSEEALSILMGLSGKTHRVFTGLSVWEAGSGKFWDFLGETLVSMKSFSIQEAKAYVATGEPMGKAGAYAIQGKAGEWVESIEGDYFNVVGLPLRGLADILSRLGIPLRVDLDQIYKSSDFQKLKFSR